MAAAHVLRNVFFVAGDDGHARRGTVVVGLDGRVTALVAAADGDAAAAEVAAATAGGVLHDVHGGEQMLVLPGLANAYITAPAEPAAHTETLLRCAIQNSAAEGVTAVALDAHAAADAAVVARLRTVAPITISVVAERPAGIVTVREALLQGSAAADLPTEGVKLGTGSLATNNGSLWQELQTYLLLQRHRATAAQALQAVRQHPLAVGADASFVVLHLRAGVDHPDTDLLAVLLRASEHDVLGTFVNGKLAYSTETLSGRTTVTNIPGTNGHVNGHHAPALAAPTPATPAPAAGLSYPNKTPDVPLERPETASGCEFDNLEDAIKDIADGKFVVVVDNEDRENEGDLIIAADAMTTEKMAFLIRYTSGLVCCAVAGERLDELRLPLMVTANTESHKTAFTHSVDFLHGTSTGISAADRAATCRALATPSAQAADFARPGHIFPLRYTEGGVLKRMGHTEASIDLCKLAGRFPAGVLCEIALDDGSMARRDFLRVFSRYHGLKMITIADMIRYRRERNLYDF